jgi:hypothetical protein
LNFFVKNLLYLVIKTKNSLSDLKAEAKMVKKVRKPKVVEAKIVGTNPDGKGIFIEILAKKVALELRFEVVKDEPEEEEQVEAEKIIMFSPPPLAT